MRKNKVESIKDILQTKMEDTARAKRAILEDLTLRYIGSECVKFTSGCLKIMLQDYVEEALPNCYKVKYGLREIEIYDKILEELIDLRDKIERV